MVFPPTRKTLTYTVGFHYLLTSGLSFNMKHPPSMTETEVQLPFLNLILSRLSYREEGICTEVVRTSKGERGPECVYLRKR